jgi:GTP cyclohydrolase II
MDLKKAFNDQGLTLIAVTPVEIQGRIWLCVGFEEVDHGLGDYPHLAFVYADRQWLIEDDLHRAVQGELSGAGDVMVRIHSECILGDAFGSSMCDCGEQMRRGMEEMEMNGRGIFVYLRQEGRGIGLRNKLDALALQYGYRDGHKGPRRYTSDEANIAIGFDVDERSYGVAAAVLKALAVRSVQLITGNPKKIGDLEAAGIRVNSAMDVCPENLSARAKEELREKISRGYVYGRADALVDGSA